MDKETKKSAHQKLNAIKDYIGYPEEILVNSNLEDLYQGLEISPTNYFQNGINMSIWSTNYHWKKLREKVIQNSNIFVILIYISDFQDFMAKFLTQFLNF